MDRDANQFRNVPVANVEEALAYSTEQSEAGQDVYLATAEYINGNTRTASNVFCSHAFWADIDCGPVKARDSKGYVDINQARLALDRFCDAAGLAPATHLVDSGGGLHAYWTLDRPVPPEIWRPHARQLKAIAKACGFWADPTRTADIASVMRFPGTLNRKYIPARPVRLLMASELPIPCDTMLIAISNAHSNWCPAKAPRPVDRREAANDRAYYDKRMDSAPPNLLKLNLALRRLDPDCDEETWKLRRIAPLAREARLHPELAADLYELAKAWSSGSLRGVPSKAWTTPGVHTRITGAVAFEKEWKRFLRVAYDGAPVTLGTIFFDAKQAA